MNVMMLLEMAASGMPDRVAFTSYDEKGQGGEHLTYQQLFDGAKAAAAEIQASNCNRVAVIDTSSFALPIALFASGCAGIPYVPINYRLTAEEINALLARVKPAYLITSKDRVDEYAKQEEITVSERQSFIDTALSADNKLEEWPMDEQQTAVLLFTSGTTGMPKAAMLRHKHLVSYILGSVEFCSAAEDDATLVCVPPYHIAGIAAILSSVYSGRRQVQLPNFTAESWLEVARKEKVSNAFVVPTMLARIVETLEENLAQGNDASLPHLKAISYGGGKMPLSVIEKAMQLFPQTDFTNAYGLTETSSTVAVLTPDDHRAAMASEEDSIRKRLTSVGKALPGVTIEIRDDAGKVLGPNQRGEIYIKGDQVSGEYEDRGSVIDNEGWFPTRDAGSMDEDGYLFLEGRADDVIVRGGENMSPGEIEDVLLMHPAVSDAGVVGIPDEQWGEGVAAAIVLKPDHSASAEELQNWVKDKMRSSRVPQAIDFRDELPYNETGKLLRRVIKAELS